MGELECVPAVAEDWFPLARRAPCAEQFPVHVG